MIKPNKYTISPDDNPIVISSWLITLPCNNGKDLLIGVSEDPEEFIRTFTRPIEGKRITNPKAGWITCVPTELYESNTDKFCDLLKNVVIPLYQNESITLKSAISIAGDMMSYREANVKHYGDSVSATDYYNAYKFLNTYSDMISKILVYADANGRSSKDHHKFIDTAFKYLRQEEIGNGDYI